MAAWETLPSELLRRAAHKSDAIEPLQLRLVCRGWARVVAGWVHTIRATSPSRDNEWLRDALAVDGLHRILTFRKLTALDLPELIGSQQAVQQLTALSQLDDLRLAWLDQHLVSRGPLLGLTSLTRLSLAEVSYGDYAPTLQGVLSVLPQLQCLEMCCSGAQEQASLEVGFVGPVRGGIGQSLAIAGSIGLSEADVRKLEGLHLSSLRAQLTSGAAFAALTALTSLSNLKISDWQPGPVGGGEPHLLTLEQFSQFQGLRVLDLEHTFGNFRVIELDGLASLSQLTELRLHIPASLEDTEELYALAHLPARVGLSMPFDGAFDFEHLCTVTSMHFQELMPVVEEGEVDPTVRQEICMGVLSSMEGLQELRISCGAAEIAGEGLTWLGEFRHLSSLRLEDATSNPGGWVADHPEAWAHAISRLTAIRELAIQGCSNLEGLQLVDLGSLTYLALSGSPSLTISGLSDLSQLRHLDASGSSRLARQCLSDAADLLQLRGLSLKGCDVSDCDVPQLLLLTRLRRLDLRVTALTAAGRHSLKRLPYLRQLRYTAETAF